jgi:hypothetical protein
VISGRSSLDLADLAELQRLLLGAVLRGDMLPGSNEPLRFPDLSFVLAQPEILLVDENLAGVPELDDPPKPIRVVSADELEAEREGDDLVYLHFGPADERDDGVRIALEARIRSGREARPAMGLGGVLARFERVGSGWQLAEPPQFVAM